MAYLMRFFHAVADLSGWGHSSGGGVATDRPMVGKYRADYSQLTPEQIAQDDPELNELYRNSRPISR